MMYFNVFKVLKKTGLPSRCIPLKFTFTPHVIASFIKKVFFLSEDTKTSIIPTSTITMATAMVTTSIARRQFSRQRLVAIVMCVIFAAK